MDEEDSPWENFHTFKAGREGGLCAQGEEQALRGTGPENRDALQGEDAKEIQEKNLQEL